MGSLLLLFSGLVFLGIAAWRILAIQSYSFKNKNVLLQERIMVVLGGIGVVILLWWILTVIF